MLEKAFSTQLGSGGDPIRLLASVRSGGSSRVFLDTFAGSTLSSAYTLLTGPGAHLAYDSLETDADAASAASASRYRRDAPTDFDDTLPYAFEMDVRLLGREGQRYVITWQENAVGNDYYYLEFYTFSNYTDVPNVGFLLRKFGVGGFIDNVTWIDTDPDVNGTVRIEVDPGVSVKVFFRGTEYLTRLSHTVSAETRIGVQVQAGLSASTGYAGIYYNASMMEWRMYYTSTSVADTTRLIASSDGDLYAENGLGGLTDLASAITLDSDHALQAAEWLGKLFIVNTTTPCYLDTDDETVKDWAAKVSSDGVGSLPADPKLIANWRGRIVITDGTAQFYMSRQAAPLDWDFSASDTDPSRAISSTSTNVDKLGYPITALIPFSNDYLIFGCLDSLWMLAGDPGVSGSQMVNLSQSVGIIGANAWCITPTGAVIFLSRYGVYAVQPGGTPVPVSQPLLPRELQNLDPSQYEISMAFDTTDYGVLLFLNNIAGGTSTQWWIDWQDQSFWPATYAEAHEACAMYSYDAFQSSGSRVMIGGSDGYIRRHANDAGSDDGTAVSSYVIIGPWSISSNPLENGRLEEIDALLGETSGNVTWEVRTGVTHYEALAATAKRSGTWTAGRNPTRNVFLRGPSAALKLSSSTSWVMDQIIGLSTPHGRIRKF
jgi:hypothetical protein